MAITLLGFKNIKSLVLLLTAANLFPRLQKSPFHHAFWRQSLLSAFLSRSLAARCGRGEMAEEAFIAGLLHDIGQAVLFSASPEEYLKAQEAAKLGALALETIEEQLFGVNHREVGGALLVRWNFPDLYADAAREHDTMNITSAHKQIVILVSAASLLAESIDSPGLSQAQQDLFAQLLPYTCLAGEDLASLTRAYAPELAQDKLLQEFQGLFDAA
jgi:HD-like signal output (HDOD) protein